MPTRPPPTDVENNVGRSVACRRRGTSGGSVAAGGSMPTRPPSTNADNNVGRSVAMQLVTWTHWEPRTFLNLTVARLITEESYRPISWHDYFARRRIVERSNIFPPDVPTLWEVGIDATMQSLTTASAGGVRTRMTCWMQFSWGWMYIVLHLEALVAVVVHRRRNLRGL